MKETYPVARMYKNPYYLMQNYYSVHLVPSEKCEKETWVRKKLQIFTERDFSPVFLLRLYIEFICYTNYLLLFMYHFNQIPFSRRALSYHGLVWSIQNKEHFIAEVSDKFNIPVCSVQCVLSWAHWSLALLSTPCRTWEEISVMMKF